ncbi:hypothetical protein AM501_09710 [Aneurinibacillus migulanus]|uniref:hypothetical protein n=1 Tax=Aneurinibacillus migulanus TaxID=47500 RepID=UPI0005B78217|nr:hypothetical protein [Aneurinibacillus migulanus]KIV56422.1 hypothetical protein TS64_09125 [Aneurinibacillus migulanus]KPD08430.1 hypothetical protein AM501_09710 [Aneurinibacillus migulanus]
MVKSLQQSNYIAPTETKDGKEFVQAEIETILGYNKKIDGINLGDIDALAINPRTNEVIVYELKFFKPATSFKSDI